MTSYFCNVHPARGVEAVRGGAQIGGHAQKERKARGTVQVCASHEMPRTITYPISNIIFLLAVKSNQRRRCLTARHPGRPTPVLRFLLTPSPACASFRNPPPFLSELQEHADEDTRRGSICKGEDDTEKKRSEDRSDGIRESSYLNLLLLFDYSAAR